MKKKLKKIYFRPDFYFESANDFCLHLGLSANDIANVTGVTSKTAENWIKNDKSPPWLLPLLYAVCGGVISCKAFYGWRLNNGTVDAPNTRYPLTASQIEAYCWHLDTLRQSQAHVTKLLDRYPRKTAKIYRFPV